MGCISVKIYFYSPEKSKGSKLHPTRYTDNGPSSNSAADDLVLDDEHDEYFNMKRLKKIKDYTGKIRSLVDPKEVQANLANYPGEEEQGSSICQIISVFIEKSGIRFLIEIVSTDYILERENRIEQNNVKVRSDKEIKEMLGVIGKRATDPFEFYLELIAKKIKNYYDKHEKKKKMKNSNRESRSRQVRFIRRRSLIRHQRFSIQPKRQNITYSDIQLWLKEISKTSERQLKKIMGDYY